MTGPFDGDEPCLIDVGEYLDDAIKHMDQETVLHIVKATFMYGIFSIRIGLTEGKADTGIISGERHYKPHHRFISLIAFVSSPRHRIGTGSHSIRQGI